MRLSDVMRGTLVIRRSDQAVAMVGAPHNGSGIEVYAEGAHPAQLWNRDVEVEPVDVRRLMMDLQIAVKAMANARIGLATLLRGKMGVWQYVRGSDVSRAEKCSFEAETAEDPTYRYRFRIVRRG